MYTLSILKTELINIQWTSCQFVWDECYLFHLDSGSLMILSLSYLEKKKKSFIDDNPFCVDDIFLKPYPSKFYILIDLELQNRFTWPIGPLLENITTFLKQEGVIVEWQAPVFQLVSGWGFLCGAVQLNKFEHLLGI